MQWNKPTEKYFITSDNGYRISKSNVEDKVIYTAWPAGITSDTPGLAYTEDIEQAKTACEIHYSKRNAI